MISKKKLGWLISALRPKVFIPILLTAALLFFAFSISDLGHVWGYIRTMAWTGVAQGFGLALGYLLLKGIQFKLLLDHIGIHLKWRKLILAFAVGEMTLQIPAGIYAQNYVLKRTGNDSFFWTSAATTSTLVIEVVLTLIVLLALGIPGWPWLRPTIAAILSLSVLLAVVVIRSERVNNLLRSERRGWLGKALRGFNQMFAGVRKLASDRVVFTAILLAICYLAALVFAFALVGRGLGFDQVGLRQAATIYLFSLSVTLFLGGLLPQLGVIEVAGLGAAKAWGYTFAEGLAMLLAFRIVWMGSIWLICGPTVWGLRKELNGSRGDDAEEPGD